MREAPPSSFPKMNRFLGSGAYLKHRQRERERETGSIMSQESDCNLADVQAAPCFLNAVCCLNTPNPRWRQGRRTLLRQIVQE